MVKLKVDHTNSEDKTKSLSNSVHLCYNTQLTDDLKLVI